MIKICSASGAAAPDPAVPYSHIHHYQTKVMWIIHIFKKQKTMIMVHNVLIAVVRNVINQTICVGLVLAQYWLLIA